MKVYPTKASALNVKHPLGHPITIAGAEWPEDGFTFRMLAQGIFTEDPTLVYRPPPPEATTPAKAK